VSARPGRGTAGAGDGRRGPARTEARASSEAPVGPEPPEAATAAGPGPAEASGGCLYIVGTPIGNLSDVTLRALETLRSVAVVAAEDTRMTRRLFARHGISTPLTPFHARNAAARLPELLRRLRRGEHVAVVTDAGTPAVSDPGEELVAAWASEGGRVVPVPGPSAALAAVSATGIAGPRWGFEGFLPRSGRGRRARLERLAADERGAVIFEAPARLAATLSDLVRVCGADRTAAVCRELTKVHESIVRGSLSELEVAARAGTIPARGEVTLVLGATIAPRGAGGRAAPVADVERAARDRVADLIAAGVAAGDAARRVSAETGIPRRRLYPVDAGRP
jgi:16S rRNA (cytidine1402-2'-O)-methyltransferase